jgi:hypothetical protein
VTTELTLLVVAVAVVAAVGLTMLRHRLRSGGPSGVDVAASQRRYLAENWSEVEAAALRSGMTADELATVRRNLLGG